MDRRGPRIDVAQGLSITSKVGRNPQKAWRGAEMGRKPGRCGVLGVPRRACYQEGGNGHLVKLGCRVKNEDRACTLGPATRSSLVTLAKEVLEEQWGQNLMGVGPREKGRGGMDNSLAEFRREKCQKRLLYS